MNFYEKYTLKELMALANLFSEKPKNNQSKKDKLMSDSRFNSQIEGLINGLQADGKKDIICETSDLKVVLPTFVGDGGITTTVKAPVIMIIPIAIYI